MAGDDGIDEQILGPPGNSTLFIITSRMYMTMTDDETVLEHQFTVRESMGFLHGWFKQLFVSELSNKYFTRQIL